MSPFQFGLFVIAIGLYILSMTHFVIRRRPEWKRNIFGLSFGRRWFRAWFTIGGCLATTIGILIMLRVIPLQ